MPIHRDDIIVGKPITIHGEVLAFHEPAEHERAISARPLADDEAIVSLRVKLGQPDPEGLMRGKDFAIQTMAPAYAAWVVSNSKTVRGRLEDFVDGETAQVLLAHFHISEQEDR